MSNPDESQRSYIGIRSDLERRREDLATQRRLFFGASSFTIGGVVKIALVIKAAARAADDYRYVFHDSMAAFNTVVGVASGTLGVLGLALWNKQRKTCQGK